MTRTGCIRLIISNSYDESIYLSKYLGSSDHHHYNNNSNNLYGQSGELLPCNNNSRRKYNYFVLLAIKMILQDFSGFSKQVNCNVGFTQVSLY